MPGMPKNRSNPVDATPAGRLVEASLHHVLGYQLAQATIVTDAVFAERVGTPFDLRPVEFTVLCLIHGWCKAATSASSTAATRATSRASSRSASASAASTSR